MCVAFAIHYSFSNEHLSGLRVGASSKIKIACTQRGMIVKRFQKRKEKKEKNSSDMVYSDVFGTTETLPPKGDFPSLFTD